MAVCYNVLGNSQQNREGRMNMYQIGNKVIYGIHGVCVVADLEKRRVDGKQVVYLALEPAGQSGSRFLVPTHNAAAMAKVRPVLSREELEALLSSKAIREDAWIRDEGQRKQLYRELISSCDRQRLAQMICCLYRYRATLSAAGKKFHMCDDNFLRDAEKILAGEIASTLEIPSTEAIKYLRSKLKEDA